MVLHVLVIQDVFNCRSIPVQEAIKCVGDAIRGVAGVLQQQLSEGGADVDRGSLDL